MVYEMMRFGDSFVFRMLRKNINPLGQVELIHQIARWIDFGIHPTIFTSCHMYKEIHTSVKFVVTLH